MSIGCSACQAVRRDWGIYGVGIMPPDNDHLAVLREQDNLYTLMVRDADGSVALRVVGSIVASFYGPDDPQVVLAMLADPANPDRPRPDDHRGGYNVDPVTGEFDEDDGARLRRPRNAWRPRTVFGYIVEGLARRRAAGIAPFAIVSCDRLQNNREVARHSFSTFAELQDPELAEWVRAHVSFPNSMVDRITPGTTTDDLGELHGRGVGDAWPVVAETVQPVGSRGRLPGRPPRLGSGRGTADRRRTAL